MDHKKVGTITLEYDRGDGTIVSEAFQAEFNNAKFNGNVSGMEGTFQGKLTANAIDAVKNLTIAGKAAAITTVSYKSYVAGIFDDDSIWRTVSDCTFTVPSADQQGGWVTAAIQYQIDDQKRDNDRFPTEYRILLDGAVIFTSPNSALFKWFYVSFKWFFHEVSARVTSPGYHTIALQYRWHDAPTNVYPQFYDITIRTDYIRK